MISKNILKYLSILAFFTLLTNCKSNAKDSDCGNDHCEDIHVENIPSETPTPSTVTPTGDPEKDWILVEQAVDAWLYFQLSDFKSYEALRRTTDYDSIRDIYTHHVRFRTMNEQGGMVTLDQDYEVDLNRPGVHGIPFHVQQK